MATDNEMSFLVKQSLRDYYFALDNREHGLVAAMRLIQTLEVAVGMEWLAGEEKKRRAAEPEKVEMAENLPTINATSKVIITLEVDNTGGPWGAESTVEQIHNRARQEALEAVRILIQRQRGMRIVGEPRVSAITYPLSTS